MQETHWKRKFLTIFAGQTISLIGSSAVQFALIWWLSAETASPVVLAMAGLAAFLPQAILGPFAGVWIDRMRRKNVVILADLSQGILALLFALALLVGEPPVWATCVLLGLRSVGSVFHTPAMQALIPTFVPADQLLRSGGWSQFLQSGAFILGPVLGALLYEHLPLSLVLATDLIGAVFACGTLAAVHIEETPAPAGERRHFVQEMRDGLRELTRDRKLFTLLVTATLFMVFFMPLASYYPLMTSSFFGLSAAHGSAVEVAYAVGMMLFSAIISAIGTIKNKLRLAFCGLLGAGLMSLLCGLVPPTMAGFYAFAVLCLLLGGFGNVYGLPTVTYMQENIPQQAQGRAFSLLGSMMSFAMPVGLLISGPVAELYGVAFWFFATGVAALVISFIGLVIMEKIR